jgi:hypothetical protein
MNRVFATIAFLLSLVPAFSQSDSSRIEISVRPNEQKPLVVPMDSLGFAVLDSRSDNLLDPANILKVVGYDTDMKEQWRQSISYNKRLSLTQYEYHESNLYLIYNNQSREEVEFYIIQSTSGEVAKYIFSYLDNLVIDDFSVINKKVYILGTLKRLPVLLEFDLSTKKVAPFSMAISAKNVKVLEVLRNGNTQITATISMEVNKEKQILAKTFDVNTKQSTEFVVKPAKEYGLLTGKLTALNAMDKLVVGTYGYRNRATSQGMYVAAYVGNREVIKKYHRFTDMSNFFDFLSDKEQTRLNEKAKKKSAKGKDLKLKYRLLVHEVLVYDDQYVMVGEAYYPTYRTESYRRRGARGYFYDTRTVFDGYKFTHAVVAAIDKRGDLTWNHSFKINDTKSFQLKERVRMLVDQDVLTLIYNIEGEIYQLQIKNGELIEKSSSVKLGKKYDNDQVRNSDLGQTEYWYDNHFLTWGYQRIKNNRGEGNMNKRNVFYINRLSY